MDILTIQLIGFVIFLAVAHTFGGVLLLFKRHWSEKSLAALTALSAGLLISIAILGFIPEAMGDGTNSPIFILMGIVVMVSIHQFFPTNHIQDHITILGPLIGMALHAFFEGFTVVNGFDSGYHLGIALWIGLVVHKIPEGLTISSLVLVKYQNRIKAVMVTLILGFSTLAGAGMALLLAGFAVPHDSISTISISFTTGVLIYVAGTNLLPMVTSMKDRKASLFFFLGIFIYFMIQQGVHFHFHPH